MVFKKNQFLPIFCFNKLAISSVDFFESFFSSELDDFEEFEEDVVVVVVVDDDDESLLSFFSVCITCCNKQ